MKKKWIVVLGVITAGAVIGGLLYKKCTADQTWDSGDDFDDEDKNDIEYIDLDLEMEDDPDYDDEDLSGLGGFES